MKWPGYFLGGQIGGDSYQERCRFRPPAAASIPNGRARTELRSQIAGVYGVEPGNRRVSAGLETAGSLTEIQEPGDWILMGEETRRSARDDSQTLLCVGGVVLKEDRILFVRQAKGHPLEGQWTFPWGIVDPPEGPEVAVLRETLEEGGIVARVRGLLGVQDLEEAGWLALVFLCEHVDGEPQCDGGRETDDAAYLSQEEIESFEEPIEVWCRWLAKRVLAGEHFLIPPREENPYGPRVAFL